MIRLLSVLAVLAATTSANAAHGSLTVTEILTTYVYTCPCDASRSISIGTTYLQADFPQTAWYGWEDADIDSTKTSTSKQNTSSRTSRSPTTQTTRSLSGTTRSSISHSNPATSTVTSSFISTTSSSVTSASSTISSTTTSSFIVVATTNPNARLAKRATLYIAFNVTGYSYLTGSQATAQGLTNDPNGNLVTTGLPSQYVGFSNSDPQLLQLFSSLPGSPVKVTINSDGALTINNVASQCDDNAAGGNALIVVQNGGATSTPAGCIPVALGAQNYVAVSYSSTCTTLTTTVNPVTSCTIYQLAGSSTLATTICQSSTSTSVAGPGTTISAVAQGCQTITPTPSA